MSWKLVILILFIIFLLFLFYKLINFNSTKYNENTVIVSITTSPKRILLMQDVINSILSQSHPPDLIRINIPNIYKRSKQSYQIPDYILDNPKIQIVRYEEDLGPIMKVLPTILDYSDHPNACIIYTDDDVLMLPNTIKTFLNYINNNPEIVYCLSGFNLERYNSWKRPRHGCFIDVVEGYMSVCLSNQIIKKLKSIKEYYNLYRHDSNCIVSDDLLLSNFYSMKQLKKYKIYETDTNFDLWWISGNELSYGKENDAIQNIDPDQHFSRYIKVLHLLQSQGMNFLTTI